MTIKLKAMGYSALGGLLLLGGMSCKKFSTENSAPTASSTRQHKQEIRLFQQVIGRSPANSEVKALAQITPYKKKVDALLGSAQYVQEGFFHQHRERLLLHFQGSVSQDFRNKADYCALRLELAEQAKREQQNKDYWNILRYREKWLPISPYQVNCFLGSSIEDIIDAFDRLETPIVDPNRRQRNADSCLLFLYERQQNNQTIKSDPAGLFPDDGPFPSDIFEEPEQPARPSANEIRQIVSKWVKPLRTLSPEQKMRTLSSTPFGQKLFVEVIKQEIPEWNEVPDSLQLEEPELVLDQGDADLMAIDDQGDGCLLTPVQAVTFGNDEAMPKPVDSSRFGEPLGLKSKLLINYENKPLFGVQNFLVKVKMPKAIMGIHGSPYWLSRHPSKKFKNKDLHRSRIIHYGYLCEHVSPDGADGSGNPPVQNPMLKPYFSEFDEHATGAKSCYNCHSHVQPIANYFGRLTGKAAIQNFNAGRFRYFAVGPEVANPQTGTELDPSHARPGGMWMGDHFFQHEGTNLGLEGFANLFSVYGKTKECVAKFAWSTLVGTDSPMTDAELENAVAAFQGNSGEERYANLVSYITTSSPRGKVYFEEVKALPEPSTEPDDPCLEFDHDAAMGIIENPQICAMCHGGQTPRFINNGSFDLDRGAGSSDSVNQADLLHLMYCEVKRKDMPKFNIGNISDDERQNLMCALAKMRDDLAPQRRDLYQQDQCIDGVPAAPQNSIHTIFNQ